MATRMQNLNLEIAHFNQFRHYIPDYNNLDPYTVNSLLQSGVIEVSTAYETAIANYSGTTVVSYDHADLSCGSDAKLSSARTCSYGTVYSAPVGGLYNKTGDLMVQVFERKHFTFYWFRFPNYTYQHIPKTSNIEIPFNLDGTPRRDNKKQINPWNYECSSFENMCDRVYNSYNITANYQLQE